MLCFDIETGSFAESLRNVRMSDAGTEFAEAAPHHNLFPAKSGERKSLSIAAAGLTKTHHPLGRVLMSLIVAA